MPLKIAASILSADVARLAEQVKLVESHADVIHIDCMDAHFVAVLSVGPVVEESLRPHSTLPFRAPGPADAARRLAAAAGRR
jgi:ribulose-phosphate 3-epimerase